MLTHGGDHRVELMRLVRKWSGGSPVEVRAALDSLPCFVAQEIGEEDLGRLRAELEALGAAYRVEIREEEPSTLREWFQAPPQAEVLDDVETLRQFLASADGVERRDEINLRVHIYHAANHPYRWWGGAWGEGEPYGEGLPWVLLGEREAWQRENVKRLEELLDPEDRESRLLLAEMARQSSHFAAALALLEPVLHDESYPFVEDLAELARQGISEVQVLAVTTATAED